MTVKPTPGCLLTLTPEQVQQILAPAKAQHDKDLAAERKTHRLAYEALQRRTNARLVKSNARADDWKSRYSDTRKNLIDARNQINELKRRLRTGEFE
jgi:pyruvate/2-oxoglutarate dehydrogenase complex dihydrolipoamide acyltransferase (E2) component